MQIEPREPLYQIMLARYYSSSLGRFMAVDAGDSAISEDPQSWNRYVYVRNNPLNRVDPDGKKDIAPHLDPKYPQAAAAGDRAIANALSSLNVTVSVTVGVNVMGGMTGASASGGIAVDTQGSAALVGTVQNRTGFGVELSADVTVTVQPGTVQDLAGGGQDITASAELIEGGTVGATISDQGDVGVCGGYTVGVGAAVSQNQGGTGLVMLRGDSPTPPPQPSSETIITKPKD